jgi:hypothetical protein
MVLHSRPRLRVAAVAASVLASLIAIPVTPAAAHPDRESQRSPQVIAVTSAGVVCDPVSA